MKLKENLLDRFFVHLFNVGKFTSSSSTTNYLLSVSYVSKVFILKISYTPPKIG